MNQKINQLLENNTNARKSFNITIKELIEQYPDIFKHTRTNQGIQLVDESKRTEAIEILTQHYKPNMKINNLKNIPDMKAIIDDKELTIKDKIDKIQKAYPNFEYSQISGFLYRIGAHENSKKDFKVDFSEKIIEIINYKNMTIIDKITKIQEIEPSINKQSIYNYITNHHIPVYKPFNLIKDELKKQNLLFTSENVKKVAKELDIPEVYWNNKTKISNFLGRNKHH